MQGKEMINNKLIIIYNKLLNSFTIKNNTISALQTKHYLKKLIKINRKTKNAHIGKIIDFIGMSNLKYKKYCNENNYYTDPYVNRKIKEAYIKLSNKAMKMQTKKKSIKNNPEKMEVEYNSDRGSYKVTYLDNRQIKDYKIQNISNLAEKRKDVLRRLTQYNYGISIFDELGINENNIYKINPDIVHIFLCEGKIDNAKMYIKEVLGGLPMHKPFSIKYVLNRDLEKGVFSKEENKRMKQMAKADRISNQLVIVSDKRAKEIAKPQTSLYIEEIKRNLKIQRIMEEKKKKVEKIKRNLEIQRIKEEKQRKVEEIKRNLKIQRILEEKKQEHAEMLRPDNSENNCKVYYVDRRGQSNNETTKHSVNKRCNIYHIESRNGKAYAIESEKIAADNER